MKFSRSRIALLALLCGSSYLHADILILKNGNKIEGTILGESAAAVRMKYRLTPKIWDEKDFPRDDIQSIVKQTPQEVEVVELRKLLPTPDLLTADKYEQVIQDRLRPFVNKYPGTPEAKEVEGIINQYQEEKTKVANGQAKVDGKWLSAEEAKQDEYNIRAYRLLTSMREKIAEQKWVEALREFDKFYNIRSGYPGSVHYPTAVQEALTVLDKYEAIISNMILEQPQAVKSRDEGLKRLVDPDLSRTKAAIAREQDSWKSTYEAERRANVRWLIPYRYDIRSLQDAQRTIATERTRLKSYDIDQLRTQNEALSAAMRAIVAMNRAETEAAINRAAKLAGGSNQREFTAILNDVRMRASTMMMELAKQRQAGTALTRGSAAIGGTPTTSVDDRVARILAEANGQTAPATQPAAAQPAAAPAAAAPQAQPGVAQQPAAAQPVAARPAVAPQPVQQAPVVLTPPPEESNLQTYIIVGMGALLVLLAAMLFQQKKKQ